MGDPDAMRYAMSDDADNGDGDGDGDGRNGDGQRWRSTMTCWRAGAPDTMIPQIAKKREEKNDV
jgi:hypothetical protein